MTDRIRAIDAVVNLWTPEVLALRPAGREAFYQGKMRVNAETDAGIDVPTMLARMETFSPAAVLEAEARGVGFACGKAAVAAALWAAGDLGAAGLQVLHYAHSGDVTGDNDSVVGYAAAALYRQPASAPPSP